MKFTLNIDKSKDEEIIVTAHERTKLIDEIERLVTNDTFELVCMDADKTAVILDFADVHCFVVENNKVYAYTDKKKYRIKYRIYQLAERLPKSFIKVNQSCIANIKQIERFDVSIAGSLIIKFKCGYTDCVSRRQLKDFKERFGI